MTLVLLFVVKASVRSSPDSTCNLRSFHLHASTQCSEREAREWPESSLATFAFFGPSVKYKIMVIRTYFNHIWTGIGFRDEIIGHPLDIDAGFL